VNPLLKRSLTGLTHSIRAMPTVLRVGPYRFHLYSREHGEPPHIHVTGDDIEAKFWPQPISIAANHGFEAAELNQVRRYVEDHCRTLITAYVRFHGR
jgi:hypothetical protein